MFIWSAIAHLLAVTSPGPDTALVIRQVARKGRLSGFYSAIGIGVGVFIHSLLASSGISLLLLSDTNLKFAITLLGALYLIYIGLSSFIPASSGGENQDIREYDTSAFFRGLLTNLLNIKALIFFVSLFTIIIDSLAGIWLLIYPIYFGLVTSAWFSFLSYMLTTPKINIVFNKHSDTIDKISSIFLLIIGLLILINLFYVN